MLFIFLMCMLTDQQMLVICFWRVIILSDVTPSILTGKVKGYKNSTLAGIKAAKYVIVKFHKGCFC